MAWLSGISKIEKNLAADRIEVERLRNEIATANEAAARIAVADRVSTLSSQAAALETRAELISSAVKVIVAEAQSLNGDAAILRREVETLQGLAGVPLPSLEAVDALALQLGQRLAELQAIRTEVATEE